MKLIRIIAVAAVLTAASCAKDGQPDQKAQARQQWNAARAGVMYGLAQDQFKNGNFPAARQTVGDALKLDPDNAQLHVLSAR
ncbi:MAG TPA: hypothetical protein PKB10_02330, partial [Tepidisphaeraceae bacterium]|nr:hypothetical protein [Tepidisphaeraceae bacterium]